MKNAFSSKLSRDLYRKGFKLTAIMLWTFLSINTLSAAVVKDENLNFSSYLKPFSAQSLWNSRPVNPILDNYVIPKSTYSPTLHEGSYSTGVFLAKSTDSVMEVYGPEKSRGIWDPDAGIQRPSIRIPHWPSDLVPASGTDGHADIVDPVTNIIHSFWKLRSVGGRWEATHYAWTKLEGTGWPTPAHFYQGVRAVSGPPSAGLVRKNEVNDGLDIINHPLALSLTFNALAPEPGYVFPATSADGSAKMNSGQIPEGALLMLPQDFDVEKIRNTTLKKVAKTLKVYGAYVVDRNHGTPFAIYVENGAGVNLHKGGWSNSAAADLDSIRTSLRQVLSTDGFIDGNGQAFKPNKNLNILSMRGPWHSKVGSTLGEFDTWQQSVVFKNSSSTITQENNSGSSMRPVIWATPHKGDKFRVTSNSKGGGKLRLMVLDKNSKKIEYDSGELSDKQFDIFTWPADKFIPIVWAISGAGGDSSVSGELIKLTEE